MVLSQQSGSQHFSKNIFGVKWQLEGHCNTAAILNTLWYRYKRIVSEISLFVLHLVKLKAHALLTLSYSE